MVLVWQASDSIIGLNGSGSSGLYGSGPAGLYSSGATDLMKVGRVMAGEWRYP